MNDKQYIRAYFDKVDDAEAVAIRLQALGADFLEVDRVHDDVDQGDGLAFPVYGNYIGPAQGGSVSSSPTSPAPATAYLLNEDENHRGENNRDEYRGETERVREHKPSDVTLNCRLVPEAVPEAISVIEKAGGKVERQSK